MKDRIILFIISIAMLSVLLSMALLHLLFYEDIKNQMFNELNAEAKVIISLLDSIDEDALDEIDINIRIIDKYDNIVYTNYNNYYLPPKEIVEKAINEDVSNEIAYSHSLETQVYNYYFKINDNYVLELYKEANEISMAYTAYISKVIMIFLFIFTLCIILSYIFSRKLIEPIYSIDYDNSIDNVYEELQPFLRKIKKQKKELEKRRKENEFSEKITEDIINSIREGLIIIDNKNNIKMHNEFGTKVFNIENEDYKGKHILELVRNQEFSSAIEDTKKYNNVNFVFKYENKVYHVLMSTLYDIKKEKNILIIFLDITNQYRAEKMRREFTANVSHELKTPLTSILGYSELILLGRVPEDNQMQFISKIKKEADSLILLIEDIIMLSLLDENEVKKDFNKFNINFLIKDIIDRLKSQADKKNIKIHYKEKNVKYIGNEKLIDVLIYNIINNAIKYNVQDGEIFINIEDTKNHLNIEIKDTGIGIPKKHFDRIFERFYRVDSSRSQKTGGTGLGLSIVKKILNYHNSDVEIKSKIDSGTTFLIKLKQ